MMADLGSGLRQLLQSLGASGAQAARSQRVAEVHVRWKCAVEAAIRRHWCSTIPTACTS